jgi:hypothetical protein
MRHWLGPRSGHAEATKVLLAHGLDPLHVDADNYTPLSLAVYQKQAKVVRLLIAAIPRERYREVRVAERVWVASNLSNTRREREVRHLKCRPV